MVMKLNFEDWKAPKKESKPVIVKAQQDTSEWFPENWAKELEAAESGTPARTVVEKYNKIIRNPKSVIVYSSTREIHDQEHLAANVFGGMISAGFF